jgi:hypothetical protein
MWLFWAPGMRVPTSHKELLSSMAMRMLSLVNDMIGSLLWGRRILNQKV